MNSFELKTFFKIAVIVVAAGTTSAWSAWSAATSIIIITIALPTTRSWTVLISFKILIAMFDIRGIAKFKFTTGNGI
jgi:hypothetical protein